MTTNIEAEAKKIIVYVEMTLCSYAMRRLKIFHRKIDTSNVLYTLEIMFPRIDDFDKDNIFLKYIHNLPKNLNCEGKLRQIIDIKAVTQSSCHRLHSNS